MKNIIKFLLNQNSFSEQENLKIPDKKNSRFLPCDFCGEYRNFLDLPDCRLNFNFDKEQIECRKESLNELEDMEPEINSYQILKYDLEKNKCVARKMKEDASVPFTAFYIQKLTEDFIKIFFTDFSTIIEAESHELPKKFYDLKKMQWICLYRKED